ncbi:MAG TPA: hypothetical protein VJ482_13680 [Acidimicrobiia bacterium]|nr:hypothetical protein [Acidimicrobiia bacterium]
MRRVTVFLMLVGSLVGFLAEPAKAEAVCIIAQGEDPDSGDITYEDVCWLAGSDGTYTVMETEPPVLYPQLGSNVDGSECWYWTTKVTQWVIISRDGTIVTIGQDVGVGIVLDTTVYACEGIPGEDLRLLAWDYLERWLLAEPRIEVSPVQGFTGLETYVWAAIPDRIEGTLTSPLGTILEVGAWVDEVVVDWGDATTSPLVLHESELGRFIGYPDGAAYHLYETKTCDEQGRTGCYPEVDGYPVTVSFRWQAAYRVGVNAWIDIGPVSPSATLAYPVDEIVTRIETTG